MSLWKCHGKWICRCHPLNLNPDASTRGRRLWDARCPFPSVKPRRPSENLADERKIALADIWGFHDKVLREVVLHRLKSQFADASLCRDDHAVRLGFVEGERDCPPEDGGGIRGFYEMLEARADRVHSDHAEIREWLEDYDPEALDVFPIYVALGRSAARRNAAAKRRMKPAND